jgi:hypothetical protein
MISALTLLVVAVCIPVGLAQTADTCRACNCQFSNIQVISQLIDERINVATTNEPSKKILIMKLLNIIVLILQLFDSLERM